MRHLRERARAELLEGGDPGIDRRRNDAAQDAEGQLAASMLIEKRDARAPGPAAQPADCGDGLLVREIENHWGNAGEPDDVGLQHA